MSRIAVDLDDTVVRSGTTELLPDAAAVLRRLARSHTLILHSCYYGDRIDALLAHPVLRKVDFQVWSDLGKPVADLYVDDRAFRFGGDWLDAERRIREILGG